MSRHIAQGKRLLQLVAVIVIVAGGYIAQRISAGKDKPLENTTGNVEVPTSSSDEVHSSRGEDAVLAAFRDRRSEVIVEVSGRVTKKLADDDEEPRHQRFIVALPSGHTLLVAHNIDLAPYVPLHPGDTVEIKGQYEWGEEGGVIHWTHHDPKGWREGGWIRVDGRKYE
ncbi:MAG: DUF3465 domain-containing protein [Phycisphaerales bacterium]